MSVFLCSGVESANKFDSLRESFGQRQNLAKLSFQVKGENSQVLRNVPIGYDRYVQIFSY